MTSIQIVDPSHPRDGLGGAPLQEDVGPSGEGGIYATRSAGSAAPSNIDTNDEHIYNIRSHQRVPDRISKRSSPSEAADEDPVLLKPGDLRERQTFKGRVLLWLTYQSIGVIYGDIGTSPLYVYSSAFKSPPSKQDVIGVLSLVLWSIFMMVTVKYVFIILHADNDGEGGTFSTYSLLSRYMNITNRDPREASLVHMKRHQTGDLQPASRYFRHQIESNKFFKNLLKIMGVLAVTMVISDGLLTPAQSVLGAVQGIEVVAPSISKGTVIGVADAILVGLFCIQPLGVSTISLAFSPIVIIWLGFNAAFGIYNLVKHDAGVAQGFNPALGFEFLIRHGEKGWRDLGGILLAFTGVEALFADVGAFSRRAIQLSWLCYTFPCLILAYLGQAAYISEHPDAYSNPFFNAAPPGTVYPALIIAILAAIVASQAIITATFLLLAQVRKLSYLPHFTVIHTSKVFHGQLYIPIANWLLMIGTILVASIYNNTTSLGNAYGVCVMFVTFFDTCMVSLTAMFVWRISPYIVFLPWLTFACIDGTYLSSALTKVPYGAWFTITLATVLACLVLLWRYGKEQQWQAEATDRFPTSHFMSTDEDGQRCLSETYGSTPLSTSRGVGIFFDKAGETTPIVFSQFVLKLTSLPEVILFFHLRPLETPSVASENRYSVSHLAISNCYRLVIRYGYNDVIITPDLAKIIVDQVRMYLQSDAELPVNQVSSSPTENITDGGPDDAIPRDLTAHSSGAEKSEDECRRSACKLSKLDEAYAHKVLYIIGKEEMKIKTDASYFRKGLLHVFLWLRDNTRNKMANLGVPTDKVIEVGFLKEI